MADEAPVTEEKVPPKKKAPAAEPASSEEKEAFVAIISSALAIALDEGMEPGDAISFAGLDGDAVTVKCGDSEHVIAADDVESNIESDDEEYVEEEAAE